MITSHDFGVHFCVVNLPAWQLAVKDGGKYPSSHFGSHWAPWSSVSRQSPDDPFSGATSSHLSGTHVDASNLPKEHIIGPDRVYPASHSGVHISPDPNVPLQSPMRPFAGGSTLLHGFGTHLLTPSLPAEQNVEPDGWYPSSHCGLQNSPWTSGRLDGHVPMLPCSMPAMVSHAIGSHDATDNSPVRHLVSPAD